jgi:nitroreductase
VEFRDVLRRRRMVRTFLDLPVAPDVLARILQAGQRAPSAGFTQGFEFVVLEGREQTEPFWEAAFAGEEREVEEGLRRSPVLVVPLAGKKAYLDRYAEPDKGWADRDESRWPVPYWYVDAAFASMLMLLAVVDEGLGAVFFGMSPPNVPRLRQALGIPEEWEPIGAIAVGHRDQDPVIGSAATRPRQPLSDVVQRGRW